MRTTALRAKKVWAGLTHPLYRKALRLGVGASVEHGEAFRGERFDSVVDVGANKGQFALFARTCFPDCRIISFEPLAPAAAVYERLFADDAKTRLVRAAVSARRGTLTMHVTEHADSSSPLEVGAAQARAFGTKEVGTEEVPAGPLGDFLQPGDLGERNLLKIDTQGYELEVLKGATDLLPRFDAIYAEVSYVELYKGQALAAEIIAYLHARGFSVAGVFNQTETDGRPVQADMLFRRR